MPTIKEVQEMKSKALREIIKGLDTNDKKQKLQFIELLGQTVPIGVKVDAEKEAITALQKEMQNKNRRIRRAAKKAIDKILSAKRVSLNPLDMFDGGVGFTSKK